MGYVIVLYFSIQLSLFLYPRQVAKVEQVELIKLGRENIGRGNSNRASTKVHRVR